MGLLKMLPVYPLAPNPPRAGGLRTLTRIHPPASLIFPFHYFSPLKENLGQVRLDEVFAYTAPPPPPPSHHHKSSHLKDYFSPTCRLEENHGQMGLVKAVTYTRHPHRPRPPPHPRPHLPIPHTIYHRGTIKEISMASESCNSSHTYTHTHTRARTYIPPPHAISHRGMFREDPGLVRLVEITDAPSPSTPQSHDFPLHTLPPTEGDPFLVGLVEVMHTSP